MIRRLTCSCGQPFTTSRPDVTECEDCRQYDVAAQAIATHLASGRLDGSFFTPPQEWDAKRDREDGCFA